MLKRRRSFSMIPVISVLQDLNKMEQPHTSTWAFWRPVMTRVIAVVTFRRILPFLSWLLAILSLPVNSYTDYRPDDKELLELSRVHLNIYMRIFNNHEGNT